MSRIVSATSWTTLSTIVNLALTMIQLAVLARILAPSVFGQFAVINMVMEIFVAFALGGISNFLIFRQDADQSTNNAIYYLALGIGSVFSVVFYLVTPILATALGYEEIIQELKVATLMLVISSLASQYQAVGMKCFKHKRVAQIDIIAKTASFIFAISNTHLGLLCLVGSVVIYQLVRLIGFMAALSKDMNLSLHVNKSIYREAFNYGIFDFGSQALNILGRQLDVIILSITLSNSQLGIYHVLKQLASRPAQALQPVINKVALPAFGEIKEVLQRFSRTYKDFYILQLFVLAFIYVPLIIFPELVVNLFFGEEYSSQYLVFAVLSCFWFVRVFSSNLVGPLVQATGQTRKHFIWNIAILIPNACVIYLSSSFGVLPLVVSMLTFQTILFPLVNYYFAGPIANVTFKYSVGAMLTVISFIAVPLLITKFFIARAVPDVFLLKESLVALSTVSASLLLFIQYKEIKSSIQRVKGF